MELRLDRLLARLREDQEALLHAIDHDPLLLRRTSGELILANAGPLLYTPQAEHQLFAKGIVYRRHPYRLVSLPLVKIYNLGEREVTVADLAALLEEPSVSLRYLQKMDGSLIQVFRADGRVWFTTRGMLEGATVTRNDSDEEGGNFDYLGEARRLAHARYPSLIHDADLLEGRTLLFELIHPSARKVTNYGERADLVFLTAFDLRSVRYLNHSEVVRLGERHGLSVVPALSPPGEGVAEQIDRLRAIWAGTDEEGAVLSFERPDEVIYRVKVKSADYLQLMRLMASCTYERTVAFLDARPSIRCWADLKAALQEIGRDQVPEELLAFYREHWERYQRYLECLDRLRVWAREEADRLHTQLGGQSERDAASYRREFARLAQQTAYPGLLFAVLDDRLDTQRLRSAFRDERAVDEALARLGIG